MRLEYIISHRETGSIAHRYIGWLYGMAEGSVADWLTADRQTTSALVAHTEKTKKGKEKVTHPLTKESLAFQKDGLYFTGVKPDELAGLDKKQAGIGVWRVQVADWYDNVEYSLSAL